MIRNQNGQKRVINPLLYRSYQERIKSFQPNKEPIIKKMFAENPEADTREDSRQSYLKNKLTSKDNIQIALPRHRNRMSFQQFINKQKHVSIEPDWINIGKPGSFYISYHPKKKQSATSSIFMTQSRRTDQTLRTKTEGKEMSSDKKTLYKTNFVKQRVVQQKFKKYQKINRKTSILFRVSKTESDYRPWSDSGREEEDCYLDIQN